LNAHHGRLTSHRFRLSQRRHRRFFGTFGLQRSATSADIKLNVIGNDATGLFINNPVVLGTKTELYSATRPSCTRQQSRITQNASSIKLVSCAVCSFHCPCHILTCLMFAPINSLSLSHKNNRCKICAGAFLATCSRLKYISVKQIFLSQFQICGETKSTFKTF